MSIELIEEDDVVAQNVQADAGAAGAGAAATAQEATGASSAAGADDATPAPAMSGMDEDEAAMLEEYGELPKDAAKALAAKERGNAFFVKGEYESAMDCYAEALLRCPDEETAARCTYHANKSAAHSMLEQWDDVVYECGEAIALDDTHTKSFLRRGRAYEKLGQLAEAVEDYKRVLALDPSERALARRLPELEKEVAAKFEAQKDEMLSKLKGFGNTILGKFGMSLDQFQAVQDPATGAYSISFNQNPQGQQAQQGEQPQP